MLTLLIFFGQVQNAVCEQGRDQNSQIVWQIFQTVLTTYVPEHKLRYINRTRDDNSNNKFAVTSNWIRSKIQFFLFLSTRANDLLRLDRYWCEKFMHRWHSKICYLTVEIILLHKYLAVYLDIERLWMKNSDASDICKLGKNKSNALLFRHARYLVNSKWILSTLKKLLKLSWITYSRLNISSSPTNPLTKQSRYYF